MPVSEDPTTEPTDAQIVAPSQRDPSQFALIFDRHYGVVRGYLERRAGRALAEELASETFLRAFAGRDSYDQQRPDARPWLFGIATNLVRKHARSEERRRRAYARSVDLRGDEGGLDGLAARADAAAHGPAIAAAVSRLAPGDRDTLLLWALSDLDYDGIAIATAVPVGTVRSRLHRARRHLQAALEPDLIQSPPDNAIAHRRKR